MTRRTLIRGLEQSGIEWSRSACHLQRGLLLCTWFLKWSVQLNGFSFQLKFSFPFRLLQSLLGLYLATVLSIRLPALCVSYVQKQVSPSYYDFLFLDLWNTMTSGYLCFDSDSVVIARCSAEIVVRLSRKTSFASNRTKNQSVRLLCWNLRENRDGIYSISLLISVIRFIFGRTTCILSNSSRCHFLSGCFFFVQCTVTAPQLFIVVTVKLSDQPVSLH